MSEGGTPSDLRLQVPSLILPAANQSITVLNATQQQQLGLDITQLISGQQLNLLASHLSGNPASEPTQPVIIVPTADENSQSKLEDLHTSALNIAVASESQSTSKTNSNKRGRPNKFVSLETGEVVRQPTKTPPATNKPKGRPRGRPCKTNAAENSDEKIVENMKTKSKRLRISDSESDGNTVVETAPPPSQRLRRSIVRNTRYSEYEVEDVPQRPENVWITEQVPASQDTKVATKSNRGRKKIAKCANETMEEESSVVELDDGVNDNDEEQVTCGSCSSQMSRKWYNEHRFKKHNGLSWIEGEDKIIDFRDTTIENQNYLSNLIREAFSKKCGKRGIRGSGKFLACETCGHHSFSAAGYLSHFRFCGVSYEERTLRMWKCPLCQRSMMPSSRYSHENSHKNKLEHKQVQDEDIESLMEPEKKTPRRKAAVKAENYIQEVLDESNPELARPAALIGFRKPKISMKGIGAVKAAWSRQLEANGQATCRNMGCNFSSSDLQVLQKHHTECTLKPAQVYECLRCTVHCLSEAAMVEHITTTHPNARNVSEVEGEDTQSDALSDFEVSSEEEIQVKPRRSTGNKATQASPDKNGCVLGMGSSLRCLMPFWTFRTKVPYRPVLKWMLDFIARHHIESSLFPNLMKPTLLTPLEQPQLYKPSTQFSATFCTSKHPHPNVDTFFVSNEEWRSLAVFSGGIESGVPLFFTGSPVSGLAWCPMPLQCREEQILAVSTLSGMDSLPSLLDTSSTPGLIQIWNTGCLSNILKPSECPRLVLGLGHSWGVVRHLTWCPSGCWSVNHYGLLAAACGDGSVKLIAVPKLDAPQIFYHAKVALTLLPHSLPERKSACIRVSWFPGKGHHHICAGFADGLVCLWKIMNPSQLLLNVDGVKPEGDELQPYLKFQAHTGPVTALELSAIGADTHPRYLFTGGVSEKNMTYWDLERLGEVSMGNFSRKARVTSSTWFSLWPMATACFEELQFGTTLIPPRNFCRHFMILPQNSATLSVDKGDWLNGIAQSTVAGEISLTLLNQVIFGMDNEKLQREKRALLTRTCIANLDGNEGVPSFLTYEEAGRQGVVFCDVPLDSDDVWCKESKTGQLPENMDPSLSVNYPLTAINNIAWNPNASSFGWIAAGYQCGFVRLLIVQCKSSDQIIRSSVDKQPKYES